MSARLFFHKKLPLKYIVQAFGNTSFDHTITLYIMVSQIKFKTDLRAVFFNYVYV